MGSLLELGSSLKASASSVKNLGFSGRHELRPGSEAAKDLEQQELEPPYQTAEVVADGGQDGVAGVPLAVPEVVAAHAVLGFEMADHRLDGGAPAQLAFDLGSTVASV